MSELQGTTPDVAAELLRALDQSASTVFVLLDEHLRIRWVSESSRWLTGADPGVRLGSSALQGVHPDDVDRLLDGVEMLRAASRDGGMPTPLQPARFRFQRFDDHSWIVMEVIAHHLVGEPDNAVLLVSARPVGGGLDGMGHVIDLLVEKAPLSETLAACAGLVPHHLGSAAVVALLDGSPIVVAPAGSIAARLAIEPRWWEGAVQRNEQLWPRDFRGFPDDLADQARGEGFNSTWVTPVHDPASGKVIGCVVLFVRTPFERNLWNEGALRSTQRLASLAIADELRRTGLATRPW